MENQAEAIDYAIIHVAMGTMLFKHKILASVGMDDETYIEFSTAYHAEELPQ